MRCLEICFAGDSHPLQLEIIFITSQSLRSYTVNSSLLGASFISSSRNLTFPIRMPDQSISDLLLQSSSTLLPRCQKLFKRCSSATPSFIVMPTHSKLVREQEVVRLRSINNIIKCSSNWLYFWIICYFFYTRGYNPSFPGYRI